MSDHETAADLRKAYEAAERELFDLDAERDKAIRDIEADYRPRLDKLGDNAVRLQKQMLNMEVLESLADRADKWAVLDSLHRQGWEDGPTKTQIRQVLGKPDSDG
jgi:hypothetical protein